MGRLTAPFRFLWGIARRSWVSIDPELRPRSGASALSLFLFLVFLVVGIVLRALGVELADVDRWVDAQGGWLDASASALFRTLCGLVLLACVGTVVAALAQGVRPGRKARRRSGLDAAGPGEGTGVDWVAAGVAALIGYFAWFGLVG